MRPARLTLPAILALTLFARVPSRRLLDTLRTGSAG